MESSNELSRSAELKASNLKDQLLTELEWQNVDERYQQKLAELIEQKTEQAISIEKKIESLIGTEQTNLNEIEAEKPGFFSLLSTKARWEEKEIQQKELIGRLQKRLEHVQEIKEEIGLFAPKIQELAQRKLEREDAELCELWSEVKAAQRGHEQLLKMNTQKKSRSRGNTLKLGVTS